MRNVILTTKLFAAALLVGCGSGYEEEVIALLKNESLAEGTAKALEWAENEKESAMARFIASVAPLVLWFRAIWYVTSHSTRCAASLALGVE